MTLRNLPGGVPEPDELIECDWYVSLDTDTNGYYYLVH